MRRLTGSYTIIRGAARRTVAIGGVAATQEQLCAALGLPCAIAATAVKPSDMAWAIVETIGRPRFRSVTATMRGDDKFTEIFNRVNLGPAQPFPDGKQKFTTTDIKTVAQLVEMYLQAMRPIRTKLRAKELLQLTLDELHDHIKLGLTVFKQAVLEEKKKSLKEAENQMNVLNTDITNTVAATFSTAIFNDIIAILRIASEVSEVAHSLALKVLDDMSICGVPFDDVTKMLVKNVAFGDGPTEDSNVLFTLVEYPERGEISLSSGNLETISDAALRTISERHQTPLTQGATLLRAPDTHPNLQRSIE